MLVIKDTVNSFNITPGLYLIIQVVKDVFDKYDLHCVVTSVDNGNDMGKGDFSSVKFRNSRNIEIQEVIEAGISLCLPSKLGLNFDDCEIEIKVFGRDPLSSMN